MSLKAAKHTYGTALDYQELAGNRNTLEFKNILEQNKMCGRE